MKHETAEQRRERLVQHAANMRQAREQKRADMHTCSPSPTDVALEALTSTLSRLASGNVATIPIATSLEEGEWTVDISVRIPGVTDYEVSASGKTLADAFAHANALLTSNHNDLRAKATRNATRYGYEV